MVTPKGMWLEDLVPGLVVEHPLTRTISQADNVQFSTQTLNPAPLHLDEDYAATTEFGQPLVNSLLTLSLVIGISVHETTHGTTVANLEIAEAAFPAPVFPGDTLHVETEVMAARESRSRPATGVVTFEHRGFNQDEVLVCRCTRRALMHRRPSR